MLRVACAQRIQSRGPTSVLPCVGIVTGLKVTAADGMLVLYGLYTRSLGQQAMRNDVLGDNAVPLFANHRIACRYVS